MLKKILAVFLCVVSLCFIGCKKKTDSSAEAPVENGQNAINYENEIGKLCADGTAGYDIVIPATAGAAVVNAAEEIVEYVQESTGVELEIRTDADGKGARAYLSLGETTFLAEEKFDVAYSELGNDGFVMKSSRKNIYVMGNTDRAVLYGAYDFLERFVGVRWFAHDCTYVPEMTTVPLYEMDLTEIPAFPNRVYLSNPLMNNPHFAAHMRMNDEYLTMPEKYGGAIDLGVQEDAVHNTLYYVFGYQKDKTAAIDPYMSEDIYKEHPEWFFVKNNKIYDICYSKVGLTESGEIDQTLENSIVKIATERMKSFILRDSNKIYFMIGQEDYIETCTCATCMLQEGRYKRSGMLVRFVNAIAREIKAWVAEEELNREIKICTFAYYYSQPAPLNKEKEPLDKTVIPEDNVYVRLAPITADNYYSMSDPNQADDVKTMFADWSKITDRFLVWSYHTAYGGYYVYYPTMHHWKEDLQMYASMDTAYVLMQSAYEENEVWTNHMETYVASKMLWNPNLDAETLKQEFMAYYYKGFSEYIDEFIDNMDVRYALNMAGVGIPESMRPSSKIGSMSALLEPQLYSVAFWERQFELLELADKRIDELDISEEEKKIYHVRVAMIRLTPQYMVAVRYDYYYPDDVFGKNKFLGEFFDNCKAIGANYWKESGQLNALKAQLGYTG